MTIDLMDYVDLADTTGKTFTYTGTNYENETYETCTTLTMKVRGPWWINGGYCYRFDFCKPHSTLGTYHYWCPLPWNTWNSGEQNTIWYLEWKDCLHLDTKWLIGHGDTTNAYANCPSSAHPPASGLYGWRHAVCPWVYILGPVPQTKRYLDETSYVGGVDWQLTSEPTPMAFSKSGVLSTWGLRGTPSSVYDWSLGLQYHANYTAGNYTGKVVRTRYRESILPHVEDWYFMENIGLVKVTQSYDATFNALSNSHANMQAFDIPSTYLDYKMELTGIA